MKKTLFILAIVALAACNNATETVKQDTLSCDSSCDSTKCDSAACDSACKEYCEPIKLK